MIIRMVRPDDGKWGELLLRHAAEPWQQRCTVPKVGEHYLLLAYLGSLFIGQELWDMGTGTGLSACAMALSGSNAVHTVDVSRVERRCDYGELPITEHDGSCLGYAAHAARSPLILLDVGHGGETERTFIRSLREHGFGGLLVLDDVLQGEMRGVAEELAVEVPMYHVSEWAHAAGTALFDFSRQAVVDVGGQQLVPTTSLTQGRQTGE